MTAGPDGDDNLEPSDPLPPTSPEAPDPASPGTAEPGPEIPTRRINPFPLEPRRSQVATAEWIDELKAISVAELFERIKALKHAFDVDPGFKLPNGNGNGNGNGNPVTSDPEDEHA